MLRSQIKDRAVKNYAFNFQWKNIDIVLNWEQVVFTQILILNLFKTIEKRNIYENRGKQNHNEKNFTNGFDTRIL
jgi:hypothetical protein